jgi:hypothetical protein
MNQPPFPPARAGKADTATIEMQVTRTSTATVHESMLTDLQQALRCGICLDQLCDPRMLPCHHTFCSNCLQRLIEAAGEGRPETEHVTVFCPFKCATPLITCTDSRAAQRLPINYVLVHVLKATSQIQTCEIHDAPAIQYCMVHGQCHCSMCITQLDCELQPMHEASKEVVNRLRLRRSRAEILLSRAEEQLGHCQTLEWQREEAQALVQSIFGQIEYALQRRYAELTQQINNIFDEQIHRQPQNDAILSALLKEEHREAGIIDTASLLQNLRAQLESTRALETQSNAELNAQTLKHGVQTLHKLDAMLSLVEQWLRHSEADALDTARNEVSRIIQNMDTASVLAAIESIGVVRAMPQHVMHVVKSDTSGDQMVNAWGKHVNGSAASSPTGEASRLFAGHSLFESNIGRQTPWPTKSVARGRVGLQQMRHRARAQSHPPEGSSSPSTSRTESEQGEESPFKRMRHN